MSQSASAGAGSSVSGTTTAPGISRRKIIKSQSKQADLNLGSNGAAEEDEGDVWFDKDTLYAVSHVWSLFHGTIFAIN